MNNMLSQEGFSLLCAYQFTSAGLCELDSIVITTILQMIKLGNREVK